MQITLSGSSSIIKNGPTTQARKILVQQQLQAMNQRSVDEHLRAIRRLHSRDEVRAEHKEIIIHLKMCFGKGLCRRQCQVHHNFHQSTCFWILNTHYKPVCPWKHNSSVLFFMQGHIKYTCAYSCSYLEFNIYFCFCLIKFVFCHSSCFNSKNPKRSKFVFIAMQAILLYVCLTKW